MRRAGGLTAFPRKEMSDSLPPLENGARLSRPEFHRRYENSPHIRRAELVEGIVYIMSSPVSIKHGSAHATLITFLGTYVIHTPGVEVTDNTTLLLDNDNEPQPDIMLRVLKSAKGARSRQSGKYVAGAPELVAEVAVSSASLDLRDKFRAYQRNGVQEYLVWRAQENQIDWWQLADGEYQPLPADDGGVIESRVFPGLRLAIPSLLGGAQAEAYAELQRGIAGEAHRAFAGTLA